MPSHFNRVGSRIGPKGRWWRGGRRSASVLAALLGLAVGGCGADRRSAAGPPALAAPASSDGAQAVALDLSRTRPTGRGRAFRPPPYGALVASAAPLGDMRCKQSGGARYGVHVELFAAGRVVIVPGGIGLAPPQRRDGAVVSSARCAYPLRTVDPTGVIQVEPARAGSRAPALGALFALWGQRLSRRRLAGFHDPRGHAVVAYLDGVRWRGDPRAILLARHAQVVLEVGPHVDPHPVYRFAPGL